MSYCRTCDRYLAEDASVVASEIAAAEKRGRAAALAELRTWAAGERMDAGVLADRYNNTREQLLEAAWTGVKRGLDVVLVKINELELEAQS